MNFIIAVMSFANFVFYPLVIGTIIAVIIEQIFRATGNEDDPNAVRNVYSLWELESTFIAKHGSLILFGLSAMRSFYL